MNAHRIAAQILLLTILATPAAPALADCTPQPRAELLVTMTDSLPVLTAKLNGMDIPFVVDSGQPTTMILPQTVTRLNLQPLKTVTSISAAARFLSPSGEASEISVYATDRKRAHNGLKLQTLAQVSTFELAAGVQGRDRWMAVGVPGAGHTAALGQDILHAGDVEYDLASGAVRIWGPGGCNPVQAQGSASTPSSVSVIDLQHWDDLPFTVAEASLNGAPIRVLLDSGVPFSILSMHAAGHAGVAYDSPGVVKADNITSISGQIVDSWIAPFDSFKIGNEEIRNGRLRIAALTLPDIDMLLGADFLLSHRILVANSEGRIYFTGNGRPAFDVKAPPGAPAGAATPADARDAGLQSIAIRSSAIVGIWIDEGLWFSPEGTQTHTARLIVSRSNGVERCAFDFPDIHLVNPCSDVEYSAPEMLFSLTTLVQGETMHCAAAVSADRQSLTGSCILVDSLWQFHHRRQH